MKKDMMSFVMGAKPKDDDDEDTEYGEDTEDTEAEYSDEEYVAAEDLISAVKARDAEGVVDAFRALKSACISDEE